MAFLHHTVVKSQSSLQTGAEHEISIWRKGQSNYHSAVLPERGQKTQKSGGEQTNKIPENSSNMKNPGEQNHQRQAEDHMVLRPATTQDNQHSIVWETEQQAQHSSCPRAGCAPSPFGASSASHTEAHKGSLFSCSLKQAVSHCWPTVHQEVMKKALTDFAGWILPPGAAAQQLSPPENHLAGTEGLSSSQKALFPSPQL